MLTDTKKNELRRLEIDRTGQRPLYAQINEKLCQLLEQNFKPGDAFYSEQEITRALGVSRITVRRVIDDMDRAGRLIRQPGRKALVAGSDLIDRVDHGDRAMRNRYRLGQPPLGRVHTIVLVGLSWKSEFVMEVIDHLTALCKTNGLELKLRIVHSDELHSFASTINGRPDEEAFLLFVGSHQGEILYSALTARGYRTVSLDTMSVDYQGNVVSTDARYAIELGLEHLLGLGHERIVLLVNEPIREESVIEKVEEFKRMMHSRGLSGRVVIAGSQNGSEGHDTAYDQMYEVWAEGSLRPTAIMTVSDPGAWAAQKWLREKGVAIPEEVSVLGFENARSSSHVMPPLTTIAHTIPEMAEKAVEILLNTTGDKTPVDERVKPTLVLRESTGPALKTAS